MKYTEPLVNNTLYFSIIIQIITGLIAVPALFVELNKDDQILKDALILETIVQFIEASFYIYISLAATAIVKITPLRYFDWFITTPTMLFSSIMFFYYNKLKDQDTVATTKNLLEYDSIIIGMIMLSNAIMLLLGYLGEKRRINKYLAVGIGSIFFLFSFYLMYDNYAKYTLIGTQLFYFIFGVWSLYAVAALQKTNLKNIMYNILDLLSKNFYGLFIAYYIWTIKVNR